jgi:hypothetical protein
VVIWEGRDQRLLDTVDSVCCCYGWFNGADPCDEHHVDCPVLCLLPHPDTLQHWCPPSSPLKSTSCPTCRVAPALLLPWQLLQGWRGPSTARRGSTGGAPAAGNRTQAAAAAPPPPHPQPPLPPQQLQQGGRKAGPPRKHSQSSSSSRCSRRGGDLWSSSRCRGNDSRRAVVCCESSSQQQQQRVVSLQQHQHQQQLAATEPHTSVHCVLPKVVLLGVW